MNDHPNELTTIQTLNRSPISQTETNHVSTRRHPHHQQPRSKNGNQKITGKSSTR